MPDLDSVRLDLDSRDIANQVELEPADVIMSATDADC